jgi:hypothetical protein
MKVDPVQRYMALHAALVKERAALEERLAKVNRALTGRAAPSAAGARGAKGASTTTQVRRRRKRARNQMPLRDAVLQVIKARPMTKQDIMAAVTRAGYKFTAKDPMNSLNALLYAKGQFKRVNGKFSPAK